MVGFAFVLSSHALLDLSLHTMPVSRLISKRAL
jgi:hypothetical protein